MEYTQKTRVINSFLRDLEANKISYDMPIQRKQGVWSDKQKNLLIQTMINGLIPIPPLHVVEEDKLYVVEGQQRLSTIQSFCDNRWKLDKHMPDYIDENGEAIPLAKKYFNELPESIQSNILETEVVMVRYTDCTRKQIAEIYEALNNGSPLSEEQKLPMLMDPDVLDILDAATQSNFFNMTMTPRQLLKGEDMSMLLQAGILLSGYDFKNFGIKEMRKYAECCDVSTAEMVANAAKELDTVFEERMKKLKKESIPMVIAGMALVKESERESYKNHIKDLFLVFENDEYSQYCGSGSGKKENIISRWEFIQRNFIN